MNIDTSETFGKFDRETEARCAQKDLELVATHLEPFFTRFVDTEVATSRNYLRLNARLCGLAMSMARALVKSGTAGKTKETALDDIARFQMAFDDEITVLYDAIQTGKLEIKDKPEPYLSRTIRGAA